TDLELTLEATGEGPAIVLIAGTGSAAVGRDAQGQIARIGGHGPLLGDEGSSFDVGRRAADQGDAAALALLQAAADDLATLVAALVERLQLKDQKFLLAKTGGMVG